jgi:protein subunit release factor A
VYINYRIKANLIEKALLFNKTKAFIVLRSNIRNKVKNQKQKQQEEQSKSLGQLTGSEKPASPMLILPFPDTERLPRPSH